MFPAPGGARSTCHRGSRRGERSGRASVPRAIARDRWSTTDDRRTFETRLRDYAALRGELAELDEAGQGDVDRMFGLSRGTTQPVATPKGISPETLELVRQALAESGPDGLSATECSERTGLARVSARRYLEQLVAGQEADVRQRYGTAGRPERRFTLRPRTQGPKRSLEP